jgi:hypothetical protein
MNVSPPLAARILRRSGTLFAHAWAVFSLRLLLSLSLAFSAFAATLAGDGPAPTDGPMDVAADTLTVAVDTLADTPASTPANCIGSTAPCTFRAAVQAMNQNGGGNIIMAPGTHTVTQTQTIVITTVVSLIASAPITLEANGPSWALDFNGGGLSASFTSSAWITIRKIGGTGGMRLQNGAEVSLVRASILNSAGVGILNNNSSLTMQDSLVANNLGGGISVLLPTATLTLTNTTISGNQNDPGLLVSNGVVTLANVTITNNSDTNDTGGLSIDAGSVTMRNSIVAGNSSEAGSPDCSGTLTSGGNNLIGDGTGCGGFVASDQVGTSVSPKDARLGPLQNNGGPTATHALLPNSPALDKGNSSTCAERDQRAVRRLQGAACDIGAFEALVVRFGQTTYPVFETVGAVTVAVTLDDNTNMPFPLSVGYSTQNGTAVAGVNYITATGTLTYQSGGSLTHTFPISIVNIPQYNPNTTFTVTLAASEGVIMAPPPIRGPLGSPITATVAITNTQPKPSMQFITNTFVISEGLGSAAITVTLSAASAVTSTATLTTSNGTALAGRDYTPITPTVTITPLATSRVVTIPITNDTKFTGDRVFQVRLSNPGQHNNLETPITASVLIKEDDPSLVYLPVMMKNYNPFNEVEPNNSKEQANPILLNYNYFGSYNGTPPNTDRDYFRFTLATTQTVTLSVSNLAPGSQFGLRDPSGNYYPDCYRGGMPYSPCTKTLGPSSPNTYYYVSVATPSSYTGIYTLRVSLP